MDLLALAREMREHGRNAIWVASELLKGQARGMTACAVRIVNPLGLHARAAAQVRSRGERFQSRIRVSRGDQEMDGKSIMGLLLLTAAQGTSVTISADGVDEIDAIATLRALVERGFDEATCA